MHKDEIEVKMISALGCLLGKMTIPKKMKKGLIETYFKSGAVRSTYLFINDKEITDGKNYNSYVGR